jgi:hypothetical protein
MGKCFILYIAKDKGVKIRANKMCLVKRKTIL